MPLRRGELHELPTLLRSSSEEGERLNPCLLNMRGTEIATPGGLGTNAPTAEEVKAEKFRSRGFDSRKI